MTSPAARIAALRQAGYAGPVDYLGFADSGDRAADMARNYWAGREARQKEEGMNIRQTISRAAGRAAAAAGTPWGRETRRAGMPERELGEAAERYLSGAPPRTGREAMLFAEFNGNDDARWERVTSPGYEPDYDPDHQPDVIRAMEDAEPAEENPDPDYDPWAGRSPEEVTADYWSGVGPEYEAAAAASEAADLEREPDSWLATSAPVWSAPEPKGTGLRFRQAGMEAGQ